jgi:hypothetical protein
VATPLADDTVVYVSDSGSDAVAMRLDRGSADFAVGVDASRPFRVDAGPALVEVPAAPVVASDPVATRFTIARSASFATVAVEHGAVRVQWRGGETSVVAGQTLRFPPDDTATVPSADRRTDEPGVAASAADPRTRVGRDSSPVDPRAVVGRSSARADDRRAAAAGASARSGDRHGIGGEHEDDDELMAAADRARQSGDLGAAEAMLHEVLAGGVEGARGAAAAFTLAKVQAQQGKHAAAAATFASVVAANPGGSLVEDALAREAEAWAAAGDATRAEDAARRDLARDPTRVHQRSVQRFVPPR